MYANPPRKWIFRTQRGTAQPLIKHSRQVWGFSSITFVSRFSEVTMFAKHTLLGLGAVGAALILAGTAKAVTLDQLINGGQIVVGNTVYSDFSYGGTDANVGCVLCDFQASVADLAFISSTTPVGADHASPAQLHHNGLATIAVKPAASSGNVWHSISPPPLRRRRHRSVGEGRLHRHASMANKGLFAAGRNVPSAGGNIDAAFRAGVILGTPATTSAPSLKSIDYASAGARFSVDYPRR